jgi:hypothetical protein
LSTNTVQSKSETDSPITVAPITSRSISSATARIPSYSSTLLWSVELSRTNAPRRSFSASSSSTRCAREPAWKTLLKKEPTGRKIADTPS